MWRIAAVVTGAFLMGFAGSMVILFLYLGKKSKQWQGLENVAVIVYLLYGGLGALGIGALSAVLTLIWNLLPIAGRHAFGIRLAAVAAAGLLLLALVQLQRYFARQAEHQEVQRESKGRQVAREEEIAFSGK